METQELVSAWVPLELPRASRTRVLRTSACSWSSERGFNMEFKSILSAHASCPGFKSSWPPPFRAPHSRRGQHHLSMHTAHTLPPAAVPTAHRTSYTKADYNQLAKGTRGRDPHVTLIHLIQVPGHLPSYTHITGRTFCSRKRPSCHRPSLPTL